MKQKNNIRSIRFSDEMAELIDQQIGDTFTQKFENLITWCVWELPQKEEELRRVQELIDRKRQQLGPRTSGGYSRLSPWTMAASFKTGKE